jgi:plastocyanin
MLRTIRLLALAALASLAIGHAAGAQAATPHTVVVKLVQRDGPVPFAFDPALVHVERGDTLEFVNAADVMHNVRFVHVAAGAKLGAAAVAPYLTKPGDTYSLVIDGRFTDGTYAYVCDPHQMIGMKGTMIVSEMRTVATAK